MLSAIASGPVRARIHATVDGLAGSGAGVSVVVSDVTGTMRIWCPSSVTALGPTHRGSFEFEIVTPSVRRQAPPPFLGAAEAIAEDVRPLEAW